MTTPPRTQSKDIPDVPILQFLDSLDESGSAFLGFHNSVANAMPAGVNSKLVNAKMKSMIKRGLVNVCDCGCRGDFVLMGAGRSLAKAAGRSEIAAKAKQSLDGV